jgi:hypothetical protein
MRTGAEHRVRPELGAIAAQVMKHADRNTESRWIAADVVKRD